MTMGGRDAQRQLENMHDELHALGNLRIANGANPDGTDLNPVLESHTGLTPLIAAAQSGHAPCLKQVLTSGCTAAMRDKCGRYALVEAARLGHDECLICLVRWLNRFPRDSETMDSCDGDGQRALCCAAKNGHVGACEILLKAGSTPNLADEHAGRTPLQSACSGAHSDVVKCLQRHGADILLQDANRDTACHILIFHDRKTRATTKDELGVHSRLCISILEEASQDLRQRAMGVANNRGETLLILSSKYGNYCMAEFLIENGPNVTSGVTCRGENALHWSCRNGDDKLTRFLCDNGCDPMLKNSSGLSPIAVATVKEAVACSAAIFASCGFTQSAPVPRTLPVMEESLLAAAMYGKSDQIKLLIDSYPRVNRYAIDSYGNTCLHLSAARGHEDATVLLVARGLSKNTQNNDGETASDVARENVAHILGLSFQDPGWRTLVKGRSTST